MHNHSTNIFAEDEPVSEGLSSATASQHSGSIIKRLAFLDRFLALWIFLAMVLGILLGCFVPSTEKVLNTATFVSVSVPIGTFLFPPQDALQASADFTSRRTHRHDVSYSVQSSIRGTQFDLQRKGLVGSTGIQLCGQLDHCTPRHGINPLVGSIEVLTSFSGWVGVGVFAR
jgi:hypothetical protein